MRTQEITKLIESTSDAAFVVDRLGVITDWNAGAAKLFGLTSDEALGRECGAILRGTDECGTICSAHCLVRQMTDRGHPVGNFDLRVETSVGRRWCNISVLTAYDEQNGSNWSIHIVREIELQKHLEVLVNGFVSKVTGLLVDNTPERPSTSLSPARYVALTEREVEILRLLAQGLRTADIAGRLNISSATVNNHVQHILTKLDAHTRLEAIRRAEQAGLL